MQFCNFGNQTLSNIFEYILTICEFFTFPLVKCNYYVYGIGSIQSHTKGLQRKKDIFYVNMRNKE